MGVRSAQERAVKDEFARTLVWEEDQHDAGDVSLAEWVTVEKALNTADDRRGLSASREALSQFSVPDVFCLKKCEDDQGKELHLVLAIVRKVSGEATSQLGQSNGRRVLFSRVRREFSSPRKTVGY